MEKEKSFEIFNNILNFNLNIILLATATELYTLLSLSVCLLVGWSVGWSKKLKLLITQRFLNQYS